MIGTDVKESSFVRSSYVHLHILKILYRQATKTIYILSYLNIRKLTVQKDMDVLERVK